MRSRGPLAVKAFCQALGLNKGMGCEAQRANTVCTEALARW